MLGTDSATSVGNAVAFAKASDATKSKRSAPGISLARSRDDLSGAFSLLYQAYLDAGLEAPRPSGIRITPYHMLPTTEVVVSKLGDEVVSTISLVGDGFLGIPMQSMYPEQVNGLRERGSRIAEVGCLADRRKSPVRFIDNFRQMTRLLAQVALVRGIDVLVVATHPRHARFYTRALGFQKFGDVSECPYAQGNPAVALYLDLEEHISEELRDQYFGTPIPSKELSPYHWDGDTRDYFRRILQRDRQISATACVEGGLASAAISGVLTS
tara:strand:+ start:43695 stop:44501 length:807 start_codon:yes stop_codon:yes gene_type:complete